MIIDMNGDEKKISKKSKKKKLTSEEIINSIEELLDQYTEDFCLFYSKDSVEYKWTNCRQSRIDEFIENHKRDQLEDFIFDCLDQYFSNSDIESIELTKIEEKQDWIEDFIEKFLYAASEMIDEEEKNSEEEKDTK